MAFVIRNHKHTNNADSFIVCCTLLFAANESEILQLHRKQQTFVLQNNADTRPFFFIFALGVSYAIDTAEYMFFVFIKPNQING